MNDHPEILHVNALKFTQDAPEKPQGLELDSEQDRQLREIKAKEAPMVLVMRTVPELTVLKDRFPNLIQEVGPKDSRKGLKHYFLDGPKLSYDKILALNGSKGKNKDGTPRGYSDPEKLKSSIETLLQHAKDQGKITVFLIGLDADLFHELRGGLRHDRNDKNGLRSMANRNKNDLKSRFSSQSLLELLTNVQVPPGLEKDFIGSSVEARLVRCMIVQAAKVKNHVLILGDSGTGKEVVARAIHDLQFGDQEKFVAVNCAAIPINLFEAELFGYTKDFRRGWKEDKIGLWEYAGEGTLFLDEIGELDIDHQAKILRTLETGKFRRVGGTEDIEAKARVLAATNRPLFSLAQSDKFREDLYYRLRAFIIRTPSLRDHEEDIPQLAQTFWGQITGSDSKRLPQDIVQELRRQGWPGNARELKMVLGTLYAFFGSENLSTKHLGHVLYYERKVAGFEAVPLPQEDVWWPRLEQIRHLRRLEEVFRVMQICLQPLVRDQQRDLITVTATHAELRFHLNELEVLCLRSDYFPSDIISLLVQDLKKKLMDLHDLLPKDISQAISYWQQELAAEVEKVLATLSQEYKKLLSGP